MTKRKVFVINQSSHDYSSAKDFGRLVYMTTGSINRFACSKMARIFENHLKNSTEHDYLLISGLSVMCAIACGMFAAKHRRLNLLIYKANKKTSEYYQERIVVFN